ncbi:hypothetical protein ACO1O0_004520 [Amphichorda felina]
MSREETDEVVDDAFSGSAQGTKIDDGGQSYPDAYQLVFPSLEDSPRVPDYIKTKQETGSDGGPQLGTFKAVLVIEKCDHELVKYLVDIARPIQEKVKIEMTMQDLY